MDIKIRRVALVIACLLEIDTVRLNLSPQFIDEDLEAQRTPVFGFGEFRQEQPDVEKPERFAGDVCVGAEIGGEKRLEMQSIQVKKLQHPYHESVSHGLRILEEVQSPKPGHRAKRDFEA